jgi:hypothetical protein
MVGVVTQRDLLVPTLLDEPAGAMEGRLPRHDVLAAVAGRARPQVGPVGGYPTAPD